MLDRDGLGANFVDFDPNDLDRYLGKKKTVESEPDFERTQPNLVYNLENTQHAVAPPPKAADWRTAEVMDPAGATDENRKDLTELEEVDADLTLEDTDTTNA